MCVSILIEGVCVQLVSRGLETSALCPVMHEAAPNNNERPHPNASSAHGESWQFNITELSEMERAALKNSKFIVFKGCQVEAGQPLQGYNREDT